jgi:hypothetical protein
MLSAIPDRDFDKAVSRLFAVSNRFGLDLSAIKSALAEITSAGDDAPPGYERVGSNGLIHRGVETQCDCCGHHYLWSQTADDYANAEKDWWAYCPICGLNGDVQADAHRDIARTGVIAPAYTAMLDCQYQRYAERDFMPVKSRAEVRAAFEQKSRGIFCDTLSVRDALMQLEQSHVGRKKRFAERIVPFPNLAKMESVL